MSRLPTQVYLHELLLLPLPGADGVADGAHLAEDGLGLLQPVTGRAVGHLLVDPGGGRERGGGQLGFRLKTK